MTENRHQHSNREILVRQKRDRQKHKTKKNKLNDLYLENHDCHDLVSQLNENEQNSREAIPHVLCNEDDNNCEELMKPTREVTEKPGDRGPPSPIVPAYCNFEAARRMHSDNLEHQPLPDAVADKAYRKLQAQGGFNPGIALDIVPQVTGVGVKSYKAGPTQCTKLKVFRPKTCGIVPNPLDTSKYSNRPHTSFSKKNVGQMDLAICWDYRPLNPNDEPKRPKHIDGSNGSAAPAVFTLVKTPRSPTQQQIETGRSGGVFSNTQGEGSFFDRDVVRQHQYFQKKDAIRVCECGNSATSHPSAKEIIYRPRSTTRHENEVKLHKRCKSSPNLSNIANPSRESYSESMIKKCYHTDGNNCLPLQSKTKKNHHHHHHNQHYRHKSSDECEHTRNQRLCQMPNQESNERPQEIVAYKQAFKAGVPHRDSTGTCTSYDSGCSSMTSSNISIPKINIPKPRNPYAKKEYTISTLVPPFACWKGGLIILFNEFNFF